MTVSILRRSLLCFAGLLLACDPLGAQTYVFQQNDVGQTVTNADGSRFTYPANNLWTQPYTTATGTGSNVYPTALTNWSAQTSLPNAAGVTAVVGPSAFDNGSVSFSGTHLNDNVSVQNLTLTGGALLLVDSSNSGGAGNRAITFTLGSGGPGTLQNDGTLDINNTDQATTVAAANALTVSGRGTIGLSRATLTGPGVITQSAGHTIQGGGGATISAPLVNGATITANDYGEYVSGSVLASGLILSGPSIVNTGTLSATGNGTLFLTGSAINNAGGLITTSSVPSTQFPTFYGIYLQGGVSITGGTLASASSDYRGSGIFRVDGRAALADVTLNAGSGIRVDDPLALTGTLTNNGTITVMGFNFSDTLTGSFTLAANAILAGNGIVNLYGGEIDATNNAVLTQAAGHTLLGATGTINASLVNNGTLEGYLTINSPTLTNNGVLLATDNTTVQQGGASTLTNYNAAAQTLTGGTYEAHSTANGASLNLNINSVAVNAATVVLDGPNANFAAINGLTDNQGSFSVLGLKQLSNAGNLTNEGLMAIGAGSTLHVAGNFAGTSASSLALVVGGSSTSGAQSPGILQANGNVSLAGTLSVSFTPGAVLPTASDTLTVLSSGSGIGGSFANVANGQRLNTTDELGSFVVNYGPDSPQGRTSVVLSQFGPVGAAAPNPTTPVVTLTASTPGVSVGSGGIAEFTVSLSSVQTSDVVINFAIKGTAVNGTDYALLKASKKIKAGKTSKPIKIIPQGNLGGAAKKTVVLALLPGNGYQVGTTEKIKVKLTE